MKKGFILILAALILLCGCSRQTGPAATQLELWVTSEERGAIYQALAESWNRENPQEPIGLDVSVYSSQSIASKFSWGFSVSVSYSDRGIPDLVELDYKTFPEFVFQQTADLYPLQNMLTKHEGTVAGERIYSKNGISFALPYHDQQLVLGYRLDLEERYPDLQGRLSTFEGLRELGEAYAKETGVGLLWVDYLGSEVFLSLYCQALETEGEQAYDQTVNFLKEGQRSGAFAMLPSGDAYSDSFLPLLAEGAVPCFVTTRAQLQSLARHEPALAETYGVAGLPSFLGSRCRVDAPAVAVAVHMSGGDPVLSRDFLEYCRFSEAAKAYPSFYLGKDGPEQANLADTYPVLGSLYRQPGQTEVTAMELSGRLEEYSRLVLDIDGE